MPEMEEKTQEFIKAVDTAKSDLDKQALNQNNPSEDSFLKEKAEPSTTWKDAVHEDFRPTADKFKSVEDLLKSYKQLEEYMSESRKGIQRPSEDAPQEEWDKFHQFLGSPKSADDYKFHNDEGQDLAPYDKEAMLDLKRNFKKAGLTTRQANQIVKFLDSNTKIQATVKDRRETERIADGFTKLRQEWGPDQFELNKNFAQKVFDKLLPDPKDQNALIRRGFASEPMMLKLLTRMGKSVLDDNLVRDLRSNNEGLGGNNDPAFINQQVKKWTREISRSDLNPREKNYADQQYEKWKKIQNPQAFD